MHPMQSTRSHLLVYSILVIITAFIDMTLSGISLSPSITDVVRYVNESYIVTCMDEAKRQVEWWQIKNKKIITEKGHPHILTLSIGIALVFERISANDRGQYLCKTGEDSTSFKLIVISPITFMDTPSVQTAQEHHSASIKCNAQGDPKPKILWKFDGKEIKPPRYKPVSSGLEIENVTLEDMGVYTCRAYQVSQVTSMFEDNKIRLIVQHKPVVPKGWSNRQQLEAYGYLGGEVNLTCKALAEPKANFTWYRQHNRTVIGRFLEEPHVSKLQLYIQKDSMFGSYKCKATNKLGSLSQIITLKKGIKPPKPNRLRFRGATSDSIIIELIGPDLNRTQITPKMLPFGLRVQYRIKGEHIEWEQASTGDYRLTNDDEGIIIDGLNHNTIYQIRAATRNIAGLSDFTPILDCRTLRIQADSVISTAALVFSPFWTTLLNTVTLCVLIEA